jgi:iron(III) transport system substrate-binding protein
MSKSIFRNLMTCVAAVAASALIASPALAQKTRLTVYSALEADQVGPYKQAFEAANPDVEINFVRDSTGVMTARVLAEKDNPRADIIWGLGASSVALFDSMGTEPYRPKASPSEAGVQGTRIRRRGPAWTRGSRSCATTRSKAAKNMRSLCRGPISAIRFGTRS